MEGVGKSVGKLSVKGSVVGVLVLGLAEGSRLVLIEGLGEGLRVGKTEGLSVVKVVDGRDGRGLLLLLVQVLVEVGNLDAEIVAVGVGNLDVVLVGSGGESETLTTTGVSLTTESKVVVLVGVGGLGGGQVCVLVGVLVGIIDGIVLGIVWVVVLIPLVVVLLGVLLLVLGLSIVGDWVRGAVSLVGGSSGESSEGSEEKGGLCELHFERVWLVLKKKVEKLDCLIGNCAVGCR